MPRSVNRLATGLTYTSPNKITLTAEFEYNGGGLSGAQWEARRDVEIDDAILDAHDGAVGRRERGGRK